MTGTAPLAPPCTQVLMASSILGLACSGGQEIAPIVDCTVVVSF
jgi:hypothetical protein